MSEKEEKKVTEITEALDNKDVSKVEKIGHETLKETNKNCCNRLKSHFIRLIKNRSFNKIVIFFTFSPLLWLLVFLVVGKSALPGEGIFFSLIAMVVAAHVVGFVFEKIKMPSLLGMLLVGIAFRNIPTINVVGNAIDPNTSSILRNISFCVILARAGLSLNLNSLKMLKWKILKLSFIPVLIEAIGFGVVGHFLLNMPILWTILMGFVVSGVSPAVVVPMMINIQESGLGVTKSIPALVIAASCIDNIVAITGHSLIIGIVFNSGQLWWIILQCPVQILIGICFGLVAAVFLSILLVDHSIKLNTLRFLFLLVISLVALLGSKAIGFTTSGPLAVLALTITVKIIWEKIDKKSSSKVEENQKLVAEMFSKIWTIIFLPFLFTLIGNEVNFQKINPSMIGLGTACIIIALVFRMLATFFSAMFSGFNHKEKLFICFAWIPKATVQAALGSIALDMARAANNQTEIEYGTNILNIAVLSIILTAPIGTLLIAFFAPKLLKKNEINDIELASNA